MGVGMNKREQLKRDLIEDRKVYQNGCEGQAFKEHECTQIFHLNEILFTRNHFRHLTPKKKEYFWDELNCAIHCSCFHEQYGHSKDYRAFWKETHNMEEYVRNAPLVIKA
ncbi:hypothetical protein LCGC14_1025260 [marine sediment metagenome]|uniref:Uncharacterized protein n=1 Tax=marine sediment metagenome TaxID=412755 RepID=A0A0F9QEA6_9ZZZZ